LAHISSKKKAHLIAEAALEKKADRIVIMEMEKIFPICDYFIVTSGDSTRKVKAIADNIEKALDERSIKHWHVEGKREGQWVLLDYSDVVVHVFLTELRQFYDLEHLWGDAPRERFSEKV